MQLKHTEGTGTAVLGLSQAAGTTKNEKLSASLPLGRLVPLSSISGPTYVTAQLLVQQVAYRLSDKIFSYSPESFDLDVALKEWASKDEPNSHGFTTGIVPLQTRAGAGAFALGYLFSADFDLSKRHIPQTLLAPSLSLRHLRASLDQLSLLYGVASPFVGHIAGADYSADDGFVPDYVTPMHISDDLGLGLVTSFSAYEAQHMAILSTLMSALLPTLHVYDGIRTSRETMRVVDALSGIGITQTYDTVLKQVKSLNKRLDTAGKLLELFRIFNDELGTDYKPFEYSGHEDAETVMVVFGSVECQLARQVAARMAADGKKVGAIGVRLYRPFIEEEFLKALPASAQHIAVLGQVRGSADVEDSSVQSALYKDVLATVSFSALASQSPNVIDLKYPASDIFDPATIEAVFQRLNSKDGQAGAVYNWSLSAQVQQYVFWDLDNSFAVRSPTTIARLLARESTNNIYIHETHDNLIQGGIVSTEIRSSRKSMEAPYAIGEADLTFVCEEKLLGEVDIVKNTRAGSKLVVVLPNFKEEELDKRLHGGARRRIHEKGIELFVLDPAYSPTIEKDVGLFVELAFLKLVRPQAVSTELAAWVSQPAGGALQEYIDVLNQCLHQVTIPSGWGELPAKDESFSLQQSIKPNSFVAFQQEETEEVLDLDDWQSTAKGFTFREVYGTQNASRPDLAVKTFTIHVKENRRLTPLTYERNIFHIEFDLGDSELTYNIGEALGIHADNDPVQVREFIDFYDLDADAIVHVPSREDPAVLETRTVYQSLVQNIDILGKPPKRFYEALAEFATDEVEKAKLASLGGKDGADEFKRRSELDFVTYVDILQEFRSARPSFHDLARIVAPLKRREYSIASAQAVTPNSIALMIVVVDWVDSKGRTRYGQATRYLSQLPVGTAVTVSVKPSVMKLPPKDTSPLIMAGLGTGLAPFRAFVQYRAMQKAQGKDIGSILLYMGSRHQREEYLYGEEWEAYLDAGVITLLGAAFSRDQPEKIYIQNRMRQTMTDIIKAYIGEEGSFYLCGPTWPVPDVTQVLEEAIAKEAQTVGRKVDPKKEIDRLKEDGRYVLEVY